MKVEYSSEYKSRCKRWHKICFDLELEEYEQFLAVAKARNCTRADLLREMVTWYLDEGVKDGRFVAFR